MQILRETHEAPEHIQNLLELYGGLNRFGGPNFRAVWSESRMDWVCGKWTDTDESGETVIREVVESRYVPKYWAINNKWLIERWYPPEHDGTPEEWLRRTRPPEHFYEEGNVPQLGPYPSRGSYKLASIVQDSEQNFVQLTMAVVEEIIFKWEKQRREQLSLAAAIEKDRAMLAKREAAKDARDMDLLNSLAPSFYGAPTTFQVGGSRE